MSTLTQRIDAIGATAKAAGHWLLLLAVFLAALLLVRACHRADDAEEETARVMEAAELTAKNHVIAQRVTAKALDVALGLSPPLKAEIARLENDLAKKPKIITVERIVTAPGPAQGVPRPEPMPGEPCPVCMFAAGDTGQIRVDSAHLRTDKGNEVVALSAECWRLTPLPETLILSGTASAPLSRVQVLPPPEKPGWGAGAAVGIGTTGGVGSVIAVSPRLLGPIEASGIFTLGEGIFAVQAGLIWRP